MMVFRFVVSLLLARRVSLRTISCCLLTVIFAFSSGNLKVRAQVQTSVSTSSADGFPPVEVSDSIQRLSAPVDTAALVKGNGLKTASSGTTKIISFGQTARNAFVPVPQRALWLALVLPGAGQIYNRKYWKLPLFYGGFLGCTYAFLWNQQMFMDYSQAYLDIMDDDPQTHSYRNFFPPTYDVESNLEQFKTVFKNRKDRFRRYRDLSAFCFIAVYLLSVVDAYVDAQLSVFDISPDLSLHVAPTVFDTRTGSRRAPLVGVGATLTF